MSLETIISAVKTTAETASGIGSVYNYKPFIMSEKDFKDKFLVHDSTLKKDIINGWMVTLVRTREVDDALGGSAGYNMRFHTIEVSGYYGISESDTSEVAFRTLLEAVVTAIRGNNTLTSTALTSGPPQIMTFRQAYLGQVLCHYAEINIEVQERVSYTFA